MRRSPRVRRSWRTATTGRRASLRQHHRRQRLITATAQTTERLQQMRRLPKDDDSTATQVRSVDHIIRRLRLSRVAFPCRGGCC